MHMLTACTHSCACDVRLDAGDDDTEARKRQRKFETLVQYSDENDGKVRRSVCVCVCVCVCGCVCVCE